MEAIAEAEQAPDVEALPDGAPPKMQNAFNKRVAQLTAKRRAAEEQTRTAVKDLLETVALTRQLLDRCRDRISRDDARAIETGLREIELEHSNNEKH